MLNLAPARTVEIERLWGHCPVQAFGTVNGLPFYFRARFDRWVFAIASTRHSDPARVAIGVEDGWCTEHRYGCIGSNDASFMPHLQARIFIATTAQYYLNEVKG